MKTEKSSFQQSGFICSKCSSQTRTYNGDKPIKCPSCGELGTTKMIWNQHIETTSTTTELSLDN